MRVGGGAELSNVLGTPHLTVASCHVRATLKFPCDRVEKCGSAWPGFAFLCPGFVQGATGLGMAVLHCAGWTLASDQKAPSPATVPAPHPIPKCRLGRTALQTLVVPRMCSSLVRSIR